MAIPERFGIDFTNSQGFDYTVTILDVDHVASSTEFTLTADNFSIEYNADPAGYDRFSPIITSSCTFEISYNGSNSTINAFITDLIQYQEDRFYVEIKKNSGADIVWRGKVVQDLIQYGDILNSRFVRITASDGLNGLKSIDFPTTSRLIETNFLDTTIQLLRNALPDDFWATSDAFISTGVQWFESRHSATTVDPIRFTQLAGYYTFWDYDEENNRVFKSCYESLEIIAKAWGARVFQSGGQWYFIQASQWKNASIELHTYTYEYFQNGGDPTDDDQSGATILSSNVSTTVRDTVDNYMSGNIYTFLPAIKRVEGLFAYDQGGIIGVVTQDDLDDNSPASVGPVNDHADSNVNLEINLKCNNLTWSTVPTTLDVTYTVTVGSYYLKSDGTWSLTSSTFNASYSYDTIGSAFIGADTFSIQTDEIPVAGTLQVSMTYNDTNVTGGTTTSYIIGSYINLDSISTKATVTNNDAANSTYVVDIGNILFGDRANQGDNHKLQTWNGTTWDDSTSWQFDGAGTTYSFTQMLVLDLMRGQKRPLRKYAGQIKADIDFLNSWLRDSRTYMPLSATFNARLSTWEGEWIETDYDTTNLTVDEVQDIGPPLRLGNSANVIQAAVNRVNAIYKVSNSGNSITSGATVTSVTVENLDKDLKAGNEISLYNPVTQTKQTFVVSADASNGSSVSVSVTSATADDDFPSGSPIIVDNISGVDASNRYKFWEERSTASNITIDTTYSHKSVTLNSGVTAVTLSTTDNDGTQVYLFNDAGGTSITLTNVDFGATSLAENELALALHVDAGWIVKVL